jgi:hypothetical protein
MTSYVPATSERLPAGDQAAAGVEQALDLLDRSESDASGRIGEREYLRRAIAQLVATQAAALEAGLGNVVEAAASATESLDAAVTGLDADEPYGDHVQAARDALSSDEVHAAVGRN